MVNCIKSKLQVKLRKVRFLGEKEMTVEIFAVFLTH